MNLPNPFLPFEPGLVGAASTAGLAIVSVGLIVAVYRLILGPSLPDRVLALDLIATLLVGLLVLYAVATAQNEYIRVAIVLALLNFLGTIAFGIYIRKRFSQ